MHEILFQLDLSAKKNLRTALKGLEGDLTYAQTRSRELLEAVIKNLKCECSKCGVWTSRGLECVGVAGIPTYNCPKCWEGLAEQTTKALKGNNQ